MQEGLSRVGTTYFDRVRPELSPEHIQLDERELPDLMATFLRIAEQVPFSEETTWRNFFEHDPLFLLSEIIAYDINEIVIEYRVLLRRLDYAYGDGEEWESAKGDLIDFVMVFFHRLDRWLRLSRFEQSLFHFDNVAAVLESYQEQFAELYQAFCNVVGEDDEEITRVWGLEERGYSERTEMDEKGSPAQYLDRPFYKIVDCFQRLQARCKTLHEESQKQPFHEPHVALTTSFLKLYQLVQEDINRFTDDFLNHFYRKMLGQSNDTDKGDELYLSFQLGTHKRQYSLMPGSHVSAGLDSAGRDILYTNDQEVVLSHAKVVAFKSLLLLRDRNIEVFEGSKFLFVSGLFKQAFGNQYSDGFGLNFGKEPVAGFGEPGAISSTGEQMDTFSEVGFYLESPYLVLEEGHRQVSLVLVCDLDSLQPLLEILSPGESSSQGAEKKGDDQLDDINTRFLKIFRDTLQIELSTEQGWLPVPNYEVLPPTSWMNGEIKIYFELDRSQPALGVVADDRLPFAPKWPVARVTLIRRRNVYAYSLLKDIRLREVRVDAEVSGVKDLVLYNDIGQIDAGGPFLPFGPTPQKGNSLLIGHRELFLRQLKSMSLTIDWQNLPETEGGLKAYYEGYGEEIDNDSFQVSVAGLRNYKFEPDADTREKKALFQEESGTLTSQTQLTDIDLEKLGLKPDYALPSKLSFDNKTKTGFLRMELVGPTFGFGFKTYPKVFAQALIQQSKKGDDTTIPNEPFSPTIRDIVLDYQSTGSMVLDKSRLRENDPAAGHRIYHIHPFGVRKVFDGENCHSDYLLPHYDHDGHLFLELKDVVAAQSLTLFFELQESIQGAAVDPLPEIQWYYLHHDAWMPFDPKNVHDHTYHFTSTGIINLRLPDAISTGNTLLPGGSFWIGAFATGDVSLLSKVRGVYANVAKYRWMANTEGGEWHDHVPARTISSLISSNTAINGVLQPFRSFGGTRKERDLDMRARVSEHLRHKGRISNGWDIEHLLLEQFDDLYQVKAIRAQKEFGREATAPTVVVVKKFDSHGQLYRPTLNYRRLNDIQTFLEDHSTAYASFRVVNPAYPITKIRCKVKFVGESEDYVHELNRAINRFLCPWFYESHRPFPLGKVFEFEDLKDALLGLDFVEFVTRLSFTILHTDDHGFSRLLDSAEMSHEKICEAVSEWSVLFPAQEHEIEVTDEESYVAPRVSRIETLAIGEDFVITEEEEPSKSAGDGGSHNQYLIFNIKTEE